MKLGQQVKKTKVHQEGGKKPRWNDVLTFAKTNDNNLKIEVWDKDMIEDDLVGEGTYSLSRAYSCPNQPLNGITCDHFRDY